MPEGLLADFGRDAKIPEEIWKEFGPSVAKFYASSA
jgi:hypothetical protein